MTKVLNLQKLEIRKDEGPNGVVASSQSNVCSNASLFNCF